MLYVDPPGVSAYRRGRSREAVGKPRGCGYRVFSPMTNVENASSSAYSNFTKRPSRRISSLE